MNQLTSYLDERFGLLTQAEFLSKKKKGTLPLYLQANFELYDGYILETPVIWAKPLKGTDLNPSQLKKQADGLKNTLKSPIIFVFDDLDAWQRKRYIDKRIAFVQPGKQFYVPELLLELNDTTTKNNSSIVRNDHLTPLAQLALLYHLQVASLANLPFGEIAPLLQLSSMSISRIVKELQSFRLVEVIGKKEKSLSFFFEGRALWDKALPFLRSPVRQIGFVSEDLPKGVFRIGGEPALASYTLLAGNRQPSYCIGKEGFLALRKADNLSPLAGKYGDYKIEVWHYNPTLLAQEKVVDKLSLYLTLAQEKDERVIGVLNDLINEMQWLKG